METRSDTRPWHLLRPSKSLATPARVIVFHIEPEIRQVADREYEHVFGRGSAMATWLVRGEIAAEESADLLRPEDFFHFVRRVQIKDRCTWIFAHGLAYQLTLLGIWDHLGRADEYFLWGVLEDPPTIVCTRRGRRLIKYVDTKNYWRMPLWELIGELPTVPLASTSCGMMSTAAHDVARYKTQALSRLVLSAIATVARERICGWQCTAASLSWAAYRRSYMHSQICIHGHAAATTLEGDSLFGGRLETFRSGLVNNTTYSLDCNSLYPHIMAMTHHPSKIISYQEETTVRELHQALLGYWCVADVAVEAPPHPLPVRRVGSVDYSQARGVYTLCGEELHRCVREGMVYAVGRLGRYEQSDLFSRFVTDLYPRKIASKEISDVANYQLYKMLLNGLSGKFAQRKREWINAPQIPCTSRWSYCWYTRAGDNRAVRCRSLAGHCQIAGEGGWKRDSFPAVTASITSGGRCRLESLVRCAGRAQTYYIDTDSIHTGEDGYLNLVQAGEIHASIHGRLKVVTRGADAYYWGAKQYRVGDMWVSNVLNLQAHDGNAGHWLQESRRGLYLTFASGLLDRVVVREQEIRTEQASARRSRALQ